MNIAEAPIHATDCEEILMDPVTAGLKAEITRWKESSVVSNVAVIFLICKAKV
jgi:hypothetical protein